MLNRKLFGIVLLSVMETYKSVAYLQRESFIGIDFHLHEIVFTTIMHPKDLFYLYSFRLCICGTYYLVM